MYMYFHLMFSGAKWCVSPLFRWKRGSQDILGSSSGCQGRSRWSRPSLRRTPRSGCSARRTGPEVWLCGYSFIVFIVQKKISSFLFWSWIFPAIWNFWKGDHVMLIWLAKLGGIQLAGVPFKFQSRQNVVCFVSNWQWIAFSEWHICSEDVRPSEENWTLISNPNSFNWQDKMREQQR